jgi:hypothetical protein
MPQSFETDLHSVAQALETALLIAGLGPEGLTEAYPSTPGVA